MANNFSDEGDFGHADARDGSTRDGSAGADRPHPGGDATDSSADVALASGHSPEEIRESITGKHVCPFCGSINESDQGACPRCTMENNGATRKATKSRIGPWYVLQTRNPAAPGMKFETLLNFVRKGRVKPRSIVRGPTTHQLWKFAAQVKGLSREFGVCYSCGNPIDPAASLCPQCNRLQDPPANPDVLLETKDAPAPAPVARPGRFKEPDLAEVDAEFVVPALGTGSEDSVSGVTLTGSMAGVAFDPTAFSRADSTPGAGAASRKKDEGFLSPKDLAAAFNLNFTPSADPDGRDAPARPIPPAGERRRPPRDARDLRPPVEPRSPAPRPAWEAEARAPRNGRPARDSRQRAPRPSPPPRAIEPFDALGAASFDEEAEAAMTPAHSARPVRGKPNPFASGSSVPPRRHRLLKVTAFLLLFTAALAAVALYLDPPLRDQALQLYTRVKDSVLHESAPGKPPAPPPSRANSAGPVHKSDPDISAGASAVRPDPTAAEASAAPAGPAADPVERVTPGSDASALGAATPASAVTPHSTPARPATEPAEPRVMPPVTLTRPPASSGGSPASQPAPAPAPAAPAPAPPVTHPSTPAGPPPEMPPPPPPTFDSGVAGAEALRLYRDAMSLEGSDPARAITRYKAIKQYPREFWPGDLDVCIRRAELRLKLQQ